MTLPVIAAPMFLVSGPELVKATCRAGVVGAFPFPNARSIAMLDEWLDDLGRELAASARAVPYAVNLTTHKTYDRLADEIVLLKNHRPGIVITALGSPAAVIETVHSYGGLVIADVNSVPLARKAVAQGVDGLALVAAGAGGHTGSLTGFAFVSEVREFFDGILVLAGGIASGAAIRAAQVLGADLCYLGTPFIVAEESLAGREYQEMVIAATPQDLVLSDKLTGAPAYYLRASLEKMGIDPDNPGEGTSMNLAGSQDQIKAWKDVWSAGHGVGSVRRRQPARGIIEDLKREYLDASQTL